jgi:4'-phosphopantetheinyl transferase
MLLADSLHLAVPDNFLRENMELHGSPELVLINLDKLQRQLAANALDPAEYLAPPELAAYQKFKYQKRKIEWLGGRLAAKQAVLRLQKQQPTPGAMRDWPISADEHGKPFFHKQTGGPAGLSISHSHGLALAMAVQGLDCGLDIQQISPATIRVKEKFCNRTEERILSSHVRPEANQATGLTMLWAAKEALRKARGGHPLTGFTAMQLTEAVCPNNEFWLLKMQVKNERHLISSFFYRDFAIALCVV